MDVWIKRTLYINYHISVYTHTHTHTHTDAMEYYSAIQKKEILPFAITWMKLEGIILSEINQTENNKHGMITLKCGI